MTEKVLCPYCGAEMGTEWSRVKIFDEWKDLYDAHRRCVKCGAQGPFVRAQTLEAAREAARAAALRRYTPPLRPMTLEEATRTEENVWYEFSGSTHIARINCVKNPEIKVYTEIYTLLQGSAWLVTSDLYGKTWRCWPRKPTEEEMRNAEWEK